MKALNSVENRIQITMLSRRLALFSLFLCGALLIQPCTATSFQWEYTDSLNQTRNYGFSATSLADSRVLLVGVGATTELYDPATGSWTVTASLNTGRIYHTATLLLDGRLLVAGGQTNGGGPRLASVEIYNPAAGTWIYTGSLDTARYYHTATVLPDGRVLVVGGLPSGVGALASAEVYDPAAGTWTYTGSLNAGRYLHTATLLLDGRVLVAGGGYDGVATAELYDPTTETWTYTGSLNYARSAHTMTLLSDGRVLLAGGTGSGYYTATAEIYDPATANWTYTGNLNRFRDGHTATLLSSGEVLVTGGDGNDEPLASAELYDPATEHWTYTGSLNTARRCHTATLLTNGKVLATAGVGLVDGELEILASAELYDPGITAATHVDGSGSIDNQGNEVTFRFSAAQSDDSSRLGQFTFCDTAAGVCTAKARVQSLTITGNTAGFGGQARLDNGTRLTFSVRVTDNGEPGTSDTISISLSTGYSISGTLANGDIRIQ